MGAPPSLTPPTLGCRSTAVHGDHHRGAPRFGGHRRFEGHGDLRAGQRGGDEYPVHFPPKPTHPRQAVHACWGPPFVGAILHGAMLTKVRAADGMTQTEVLKRHYYYDNASRVLDTTRPTATVQTHVHAAAGGAFTLLRDGDTNHAMTPQDMLALQSFPPSYLVTTSVTDVRASVSVTGTIPTRCRNREMSKVTRLPGPRYGASYGHRHRAGASCYRPPPVGGFRPCLRH